MYFIIQRAKLKDSEAELQQCNDQMKTNLKAQQVELDEKCQFQKEKATLKPDNILLTLTNMYNLYS